MKISRRRLIQIIKEEKQRVNELFGFGGPSDEELAAASSADAAALYDAMKGAGTKEDVIRDILLRRTEDLSTLAQEFDQLLVAAEESDDLATWLEDDGMEEEAELIRGGGAADAAEAWASAVEGGSSGQGALDAVGVKPMGAAAALGVDPASGAIDALSESTELLRKYIREAVRAKKSIQ